MLSVGGDPQHHHRVTFITNIFYGLQMSFLTFILMARLYCIFDGTKLAISKITMIIFTSWYTFGIVVSALTIITGIKWPHLYVYCAVIASVAVYATNICISLLFVYKLIRVRNETRTVNKESNLDLKVLNTITKNTMLAVLSVFVSVITVALFLMHGYKNDNIFIYIFSVFDVCI